MEVFDGLKIFDIEELFFNGIVYGFDIAVVAPSFYRDSLMDGLEALNYFFKTIPCFVLPVAADEL